MSTFGIGGGLRSGGSQDIRRIDSCRDQALGGHTLIGCSGSTTAPPGSAGSTAPMGSGGVAAVALPSSSSSAGGLGQCLGSGLVGAAPSSSSSAPAVPPPHVLEVVDVDLTPEPVLVFFKVSVHPSGNPTSAHHVMKQHSDLQQFHHALTRELRKRADKLPSLPPTRAPEELATREFCAELNEYFSRLTQRPEAVETYSFVNFFQITDEYHGHARQSRRALTAATCSPSSHSGVGTPFARSASGAYTRSPVGSSHLSTPGGSATQLPTPVGSLAQPASPLGAAVSPSTPDAHRGSATDARRTVEFALPARNPAGIRDAPPRAPAASPAPVIATLGREAPIVTAATTPNPSPAQPVGIRTVPTAVDEPLPARAPPTSAHWESYESIASQGKWTSDGFMSSGEHQTQTVDAHKKSQRRRPVCVVCMAARQEIAIDPCGHLSMCHTCAASVQACPICRGPIEKQLRVYVVT